MIRRNHIDSGRKIDRDGIRSRPRQVSERPSSVSRAPFRTPCDISFDQNIRLTSNNKKYHQYKEEKEGKGKQPQQFREESRSSVPFAEINRHQHNITTEDGKLKRDYAYDFEDTLKIDYGSISLKPPQRATVTTVQPKPESGDIDCIEYRVNRNRQPASCTLSLDQTFAESSPAKDKPSNYSSFKDRRYGNIKGFTPLFEETKNVEQSSTKRQSEVGKIYEPSSQKIIKTDYLNQRETTNKDVSSRNNSTTEYSNISKYVSTRSNSQAHYSSKYMHSTPIATENIEATKGRMNIGEPKMTLEDRVRVKIGDEKIGKTVEGAWMMGAPTLPASYHREEVSQKLRMISDFNDQINERIKNIIGCFQGIKNKL